MNKCTAFDVIKRQQLNRKNPFAFETVRQIVILRLLSFNPSTIRWATGIKLAYVKLILREYGVMPRTRSGAIFWKRSFGLQKALREQLKIPDWAPDYAEHAFNRGNRDLLASFGVDSWVQLEIPAVDPNVPRTSGLRARGALKLQVL